MPTIPLFKIDAPPEAWHQVRAPGGYECWRFIADDAQSDRQIIVELWDGDALNLRYIRDYLRFVQHPTRSQPPVPQQFRALKARVYQGGKLSAGGTMICPPDQFAAQTDQLNVSMGASRISGESGAILLRINSPQVAISLTFQPRNKNEAQVFDLAADRIGGTHRWIFSDTLCEVRGEVTFPRTNHVVALACAGCYDHYFGDRPLGAIARRIFRGYALAGDRCVAFVVVDPMQQDSERTSPTRAVRGIEVNPDGVREIDSTICEITESPAHPLAINFGEHLRLDSPRVLDDSDGIVRLTYAGTVRGRPARAICELWRR